jgi:hypothetical protein
METRRYGIKAKYGQKAHLAFEYDFDERYRFYPRLKCQSKIKVEECFMKFTFYDYQKLTSKLDGCVRCRRAYDMQLFKRKASLELGYFLFWIFPATMKHEANFEWDCYIASGFQNVITLK